VARYFGTDHREQRLTPGKMIEILPEIWGFLDEPLADASVIPTHLLARFVREHVTVALGGDGGDELFAGYDTFVAHRAANICRIAPRFLFSRVIGPTVARLPVSTANMSFDFKAKQFLKGLPFDAARRNQVWLGAFAPDEQTGLMQPDLVRRLDGYDPYRVMDLAAEGVRFRDETDLLVFLYSKFYLAEDILTKVDRASMAASLEVRAPFLDVEFAEFVNRLPSNLKIRGLSRKYILKKALARVLPPEVLNRKKKGFGIPLAKWFKEDLKEDLLETLHPDRLAADGLFQPAAVARLIRDHLEGARDNRKQLFTLYVFHKWKKHTLDPALGVSRPQVLPLARRTGEDGVRPTVAV
jgi:asparagine synthase (glutamine-hydrolysing)